MRSMTIKYQLCAGTVLGPGNLLANKTDRIPAFAMLNILMVVGERTIQSTNT